MAGGFFTILSHQGSPYGEVWEQITCVILRKSININKNNKSCQSFPNESLCRSFNTGMNQGVDLSAY